MELHELIEKTKLAWLMRVENKVDDLGESIKAETLGSIGNAIAQFEYNELYKNSKPIENIIKENMENIVVGENEETQDRM